MKKSLYVLAACALMLNVSCSSDYLDVESNESASTETIFSTADNVKLAVNGLAKIMSKQYLSKQGCNGEGTIKVWYGNYPGNDYQKSALTSWKDITNGNLMQNTSSLYLYYPWFYYYKIIGNANTIICRVDNVTGEEKDKQFYKAQALTFRAYCYSQLVQLYSKRWMDSNNGSSRGVVLRIDESKSEMPASTLAECYTQIYKDLDEAISLYQSSGEDRTSSENYLPSLDVAYAVYARAARNREDWTTAAKYAPLARQHTGLMTNAEYTSGFNTPNSEWIWSVYSSEQETLYYYQYFAFEGSNSSASLCRNYPSAISKELFDKIPDTDIRRYLFLDPDTNTYNVNTGAAEKYLTTRAKNTYGSKLYSTSKVYAYMQFKQQATAMPGVGQFSIFRGSEMYLIEAEAQYHLGNETEARNLLIALNAESDRDEDYTCDKTGQDLLDEIRLYYRIELWGEGHDWFNYKRWGLPIVRHSAKEGGSFNTNFAVTINPSDHNGWTWSFPDKEVDYNSEIRSPEE